MKLYSSAFCAFFLFTSVTARILDQSRLTLEILGNKFQTDKGGAHDYTKIYNFYFEPIRHESINFLEIGFLTGNSARMWDNYFPNATLHFIDIDKNLFQYNNGLSSRCFFHTVDQSSRKELLDFIDLIKEPFDIIIDDGGHTMDQQQISFTVLFPYVKKGGVYIIEDLHTSYWQNFGTGSLGAPGNPQVGPHSTIIFLQNLINDLNYISSYTGYAHIEAAKKNASVNFFNSLTMYQKEITSIHFYRSLCFIFK